MGIFRNYQKEEELRIAKEVIDADRRTKTQFELRMKNFNMERIIATLVALVVAYVISFIIMPDQRKKPAIEQQPAQIESIQ